MIRVRVAGATDQPMLIAFIRDHWASSHIFVERPDVFAWQHLQTNSRLNMVLAERVDDDATAVLGVLGFIPMGRYSPDLGDRDVLLAIWKVDEAAAPPGLGLRLLKFVQAELRPRMIAAIGTSEMVRPIYEVLRYQVGALDQAAIFHPDRSDELKVAENVPAHAFARAGDDHAGIELVPLTVDTPDEESAIITELGAIHLPQKDWTYVRTRYLEHPWYDYDVRLVVDQEAPVAVVVWREVEAAGTSVLRVVDVIGAHDWLRRARPALQHAVIAADAEYLDLMHWGIDAAILREGGFVSLTDDADLVVPNYFSPFERHNVQVELAVKVLDDDTPEPVLFRADADQDRPNRASEVDSVS